MVLKSVYFLKELAMNRLYNLEITETSCGIMIIVCMYMTWNARKQSRRLRYKAAIHVPDFQTLVPAPELSLADAKNNPFRNMTTHIIGSDSSGAGTRESKSDTCTAALQQGRRLRHLAFLDTCRILNSAFLILATIVCVVRH